MLFSRAVLNGEYDMLELRYRPISQEIQRPVRSDKRKFIIALAWEAEATVDFRIVSRMNFYMVANLSMGLLGALTEDSSFTLTSS